MTTYNQLKNIVPADQALASKALQAGLEQVKNIFDAALPVVAVAATGLETTKGLNSVSSLDQPLPANVVTYYQTQFYNGSGPFGTLYVTDLIGTPTGCVIASALNSTTTILTQMTTEGDFVSLTNGTTGVYTVMETTITGSYTDEDPPLSGQFFTTIPGGLPGAGSYGPANSANASIQLAFSSGLSPAMVTAVNAIATANPTQVATANSDFANIALQISTENTNLALADVQFGNLIANQTPWSLVYGLSTDALDTTEGGSAYVLQSLADLSTQGGQAIVASMREARNQVRLSAAGLGTDILLSDTGPEPQADLTRGDYTAQEAANQKIT